MYVFQQDRTHNNNGSLTSYFFIPDACQWNDNRWWRRNETRSWRAEPTNWGKDIIVIAYVDYTQSRRTSSILFSNFQNDVENYTAGDAEPATDTTTQGQEQEQMGTDTTPTTEVVDEEVQRDIEEGKVKNHNLEINIV